MELVIRVLGLMLGIFFIIFGGELFFFPVFDGIKEKLNAITMLLMGGIFTHYGITGNIIFRKSRKNEK